MKCRAAITAILDGGVRDPALEAHLAECSECRRLSAAAGLLAAAGGAEHSVDMSDEKLRETRTLAARYAVRSAGRSSMAWYPTLLRPANLAWAAALLVVAGGFLISRRESDTSRLASAVPSVREAAVDYTELDREIGATLNSVAYGLRRFESDYLLAREVSQLQKRAIRLRRQIVLLSCELESDLAAGRSG